MSNRPIYPAMNSITPNFYQATDVEENRTSRKATLKKQEEEDWNALPARLRKNRDEMQRESTCHDRLVTVIQGIGFILFGILLIVVAIIGIWFLSVVIGIFVVVVNYLFENTMVAMFGRAAYNKNFPVCTDTVYNSAGCYTQTSTYCS